MWKVALFPLTRKTWWYQIRYSFNYCTKYRLNGISHSQSIVVSNAKIEIRSDLPLKVRSFVVFSFFLLSNHLFDCFNSVRFLDWLFFYPIVSILSLYGNLVVFCSLFSLPTSFSIIISIYEDIFFICFLFLCNFWWMEFFFFFVVVPKCGCYYWHFVLVASAFSGELYKEIVVTPLRLIRFKLHWIQQMRFSML